MSKKDLFIGIAVAKPEGFDPLPDGLYGTLDSIATWARKSDYDVWTWSDEGGFNISANTIKEEIAKAGKEGERLSGRLSRRRRILIYFCGHGLFNQQQIWVLSGGLKGWDSLLGVNRLTGRLKRWAPKQIGVISDACATYARKIQYDLTDFVPKPQNPQYGVDPELDKYFAASDDVSTYALKSGPIFSDIIKDALIGTPPPDECVSPHFNAVVSQTLGPYLKSTFKTRFSITGGECSPLIEPGFAEYTIYRTLGDPAENTPAYETLSAAHMANAEEKAENARKAEADIESILGKNPEHISPETLPIKIKDPSTWSKIILSSPIPKPVFEASPERIIFNRGTVRAVRRFRKLKSLGFNDDTNGMRPVQFHDGLYLIPEFRNFTTWLSGDYQSMVKLDNIETPDGPKLAMPNIHRQALKGVSTLEVAARQVIKVKTNGVALIQKFLQKQSDDAFTEVLSKETAQSRLNDPFELIALAYFCHRCGKTDYLRKLVRSLASKPPVYGLPFDLALLSDFAITRNDDNQLYVQVADGEAATLATELPLLPYGWSLMADARLPDFYAGIEDLPRRLLGAVLPIISDSQSIEQARLFLKENFSKETINETGLHTRDQ